MKLSAIDEKIRTQSTSWLRQKAYHWILTYKFCITIMRVSVVSGLIRLHRPTSVS